MSNFTSINPSQFTQLLNALNNGGGGGGGGGGSYTLPIASNSVLGGVKVGNGLSIENDGTLNVSSEVQYSTVEKRIGTWVDGAPLYEKTLVGTIELEGYNRAIIGNINDLLPNSNIKFFNCTMTSNIGIINESRVDVFTALDDNGSLVISQSYTGQTKTWSYNICFRYTKN